MKSTLPPSTQSASSEYLCAFVRFHLAVLFLIVATAALAQDFSISTLTGNNAVVAEAIALVGDDRGGIAVSGSQVFLTGDAATARFNRDTLGSGASLGVTRDGLVANLASSTVYLLGDGLVALPVGGGTLSSLIELNGATGVPNGTVVRLSYPITLTGNSSSVGIFSGWNRIVVHTGSRAYRVSLPDGAVADLGAMPTPTRSASESWAYWGVAENVGTDTYIVHVANNTTISRTRVPSGPTTTVATFANLSDMASFTVSVSQNRWYFHHEVASQFAAFQETLGYADATFLTPAVPPTITVQPAAVSVIKGEAATLSFSASGPGPLTYQWYKDVGAGPVLIVGATASTYSIGVTTLADAGNYSVVVANGNGNATSSGAALTVTSLDADFFQIGSLTANNAVVVDAGSLAGDDRGGLAVSGSQVFLTGDNSTARFDRDTLGSGAGLGVIHDGLVANLATSTVYLLGNGSTPLPSGGGMLNSLIELDGATGVLSGTVINLSTNIPVAGIGGTVGIFSGWNRIVVHTGSRAYRIVLPAGTVTDLGPMAAPTHSASESWAYWGVAESVGADTYIVCIANNTTVARTQVPGGLTTTVATFANLNDMASFTVSVAQNRWYFHHEGSSQFGAFNEALGYADATFLYQPPAPNTAPGFAIPGSYTLTVMEGAGAQTVSTFATSISPGPASESAQTVSFVVTTDNDALFLEPPAISADGTLTFTPFPGANGAATVAVVAQDNGGTAYGGVDTSTAQTFTITVTPVNDPPSFTLTVGSGGTGGNRVVAWGNNYYGETDVPASATNVVAVAGGIHSSLALRGDGTVVAWGSFTNVPAGLSDVAAIATAGWDSVYFALRSNGTVVAWVKPGVWPGYYTNLTNVPASLINVAAIAGGSGSTYALALRSNQTVVAWGSITNVPAILTNVVAIAAGPSAPLALRSDGTVVAWNSQGTLLTNVPPSATNVVAISANGTANLALRGNGTVVAWGLTNAGALDVPASATNLIAIGGGGNYRGVSHSLALRGDGTVVAWGYNYHGQTNVPAGLANVVAVGRGGGFHSLALVAGVSDAVTVLEDSGSFSRAGIATGISPGSADEAGQSVSFTVTTDNSGLFSAPPAMNAAGTLTFTPAPNAAGSATVTVTGRDDGVPSATGAPQTFTITVTPVNDAPAFTLSAAALSVNSLLGAQTVANFLTGISAGPADESTQTVSFTATSDTPALFSVAPSLSADGTLTFTPAPGTFGTAVVTVLAHDTGGTASGGVDTSPAQTFTITVTSGNRPPTVTFATSSVVVLEDSGAYGGGTDFATFSPGPQNESAQTLLGYTLANDNPGLFSAPPAINNSGTLTFTPAANAHGTVTVTVVAQDSGGTADGGVDRSTNTFTLTVSPVNDAPSFTLPAGPAGAAGVVWTVHDSNRNWDSVASSADGSKLVAVVNGGQIYTSTDAGVTWTARDSSRGWRSVASSADGSGLVAVEFGGQIYTSTDAGVTWTARDSSRYWQSVASSSQGSSLVAVERDRQIYTSTDSGVTWTARDSSRAWNSVASSEDGSKLVAVVVGGQIYTSTDAGVTWIARDSNRSWYSVASSSDGSKLVAVVSGGQIYTSTDAGVTWTARDSNRSWISVASSADGSGLVAVENGGQIYTSADAGVTWTARDSNRAWRSVASAADGSRLVAVVYGGQIYTSAGIAGAYTLTVSEDSGTYTTNNFATNILAGPPNESAQVVSFVVTNDNNALFSTQPAIAATGALTFTPAGNSNGVATVTVIAVDNGGLPAADTSAPQTFTITVTAVNDAPSFNLTGTSVMVFPSDGGVVARSNWATNISTGPADESGQTLTLVCTNSSPALFVDQPVILANGTLEFTPELTASGVVTVGVKAVDNGGTANGGADTSGWQLFTIAFAPVKVFVSASPVVIAGSTVEVPISLAGGGTEGAVSFTLTYDRPRLTFQSVAVEPGSGLSLTWTEPYPDLTKVGIIVTKPAGTAFPAGTNVMLRMTFQAPAGTSPTNTPLGFSSTPVLQQVSDATANVLPNVLYVPGSVTILAVPPLEGDVAPRSGGSGAVTVSDAVQLTRFVAGWDSITDFTVNGEFQRADSAPRAMFGDGRVTLIDLVQTLRYAAGQDPATSAGGPTEPVVAALPQSRLPAAVGGRVVRVAGGNLIAGRANIASVQMDALGNEAGVQLSLGFDPAALTFVSATTGSGASGATVVANAQRASSGRVGLLLVMPAGSNIAAGTRDLITLTFTVNGTGSTTVTVLDDTAASPREVADVNANPVGATYVGGTFNLVLPAGLRVAAMERAPDGSPRLVIGNTDGTPITTEQAARYAVHVTSDLGGAWTLLPNALVLENGALKIVDPAANGAGLRFYRIAETP